MAWSPIDSLELPEMGSSATAEIDGQIAEIDENLERRELSIPERAKLIKARVDMLEARRQISGEVAQAAPLRQPGKGAGAVGGIRQAARELGISRDKVRRNLAIADLPRQTIEKAEQLGLDTNQEALLAAAKETTPEAQAAVLEARGRPAGAASRVHGCSAISPRQ